MNQSERPGIILPVTEGSEMAVTKIKVKPEVIKGLRERLNIPEEIAAKKLGVSVDKLRAIESAETEVSISKLKRYSRILYHKWGVFLLDSLPPAPKNGTDHRNLKLRGTAFSTDTILAFWKADRILRLADEIDGRKLEPVLSGILVGKDLNQWEEIADSTRRVLGISLEDQFAWKEPLKAYRAWTQALEQRGVYVSELKMSVDETDAFCRREADRAIVVINGNDEHPNHKIFSLAHELGHIITGDSSICDIKLAPNPQGDDRENFCDNFAGALLMPKAHLTSFVSGLSHIPDDLINSLSRKFSVSSLAVLTRLKVLGFIPPDEYFARYSAFIAKIKNHKKKKGKPGFAPSENFHPRQWVKANSKGFVLDSIMALEDGRITRKDVGNYLDLKPTHIPKIVSYLGGS